MTHFRPPSNGVNHPLRPHGHGTQRFGSKAFRIECAVPPWSSARVDMKPLSLLRPSIILTVCLAFSSATTLLAADPADDELKRKAAEVEKLKADLERAQKELQTIKED